MNGCRENKDIFELLGAYTLDPGQSLRAAGNFEERKEELALERNLGPLRVPCSYGDARENDCCRVRLSGNHLPNKFICLPLPPLGREQYAERLQNEVCGGAVWVELQHTAQDPLSEIGHVRCGFGAIRLI